MAERTVEIAARHEWRIWRATLAGGPENIQNALSHGYEPFAGYVCAGQEIVLLKKLVELSPAKVVPLKSINGGAA